MPERDFEAEKAALLPHIKKARVALKEAFFDMLRWTLDDTDPEFKRVNVKFIVSIGEKYGKLRELNKQYDEIVFWQQRSMKNDEPELCGVNPDTIFFSEIDPHYEIYRDPLTGRETLINTAYADDGIDNAVNKIMGL